MREGVEINSVYKPLYLSKKRYFLITGGRGSLKSTTVHDFVCRLTYDLNQGILFTRYTMTSAEKSIIPEFRVVAQRNGSINDFHFKENRITNTRTGSFIIFSGIKTSSGDQTASLKSISGITTWIIEEGEEFKDEKTFDDIDNSVRSILNTNRVIWIQNPSTPEHFIYKRWIERYGKTINVHGFDVTVSNHPDVEHIHTTYHIAKKYLSDSFINKAEALRLENPKKYYHTYIGGWLEVAEGVIYENWERGVFDDSLPYGYGLDYGYNPDPLALVKVAVDDNNKKIYVKQIIYACWLSSETVLNSIDFLTDKDDIKVADTNDNRLSDDLYQRGHNMVRAIKPPGSVVNRIRRISDYKIIVCDSPDIEKELRNWVWNDKKADIPIGKYNHALDAMGYIFDYLTR